ncbi:MAG: calcium-binding protein [Pseudomonadota bacterium]
MAKVLGTVTNIGVEDQIFAELQQGPIVGTDESELVIGTLIRDVMEGLGGNDVMLGLSGDDTMDGGDGTDFMAGGLDDDTMSGGNDNDTMLGGAGNDTVIGNKGDDEMRGGRGDDLLVWNNGDGSDKMRGGAGEDKTQVNFFTDLVEDDLQNEDTARIETSKKGVSFARTELNGQSVNGLFALDIAEVEALDVNFGGGDDTAELVGEVVSEIDITLEGGEDEAGDTLDLSELADAAIVDLDIEYGGKESLSQNGMIETGGATAIANDFENVIGTDFADMIYGNAENNILSGGLENDTLNGGHGDDEIIGNKGDDIMRGGSGDDLLVWNNGDGSDLMKGGEGDDTTQVNFFTDLVEDDLDNDDTARFQTSDNGITFARTVLNGQTVNGLFQLDIRDVETIETNFGDGEDTAELVGDILSEIKVDLDGGDDSADTRAAKSADDLDQGDTLDLSELDGGARVDLDALNQGVLQGPSEGSDATAPGLSETGQVTQGENTAEIDDFENVIGTEFDDVIFGNAQNNVLIGGDGDDVLHPFAGDDFVDGGAGTDTLLLNGFPKGSRVDMGDGTAAFLDGTGGVNHFVNIENVNGSSVAGDVIIGNAGANVLNGLGGNDTLRGGGGDDHLIGGDNVDRARAEAQGNNADRLGGGNGNDLVEGGLGNDRVSGGNGDDVLDGGDGKDRLFGGSGNDTMTGGAGEDRFVFRDNEGHDDITDFSVSDDQVALGGVSNIEDFDDLLDNHIAQVGDDVVINDDAGTQVTLLDTALGDLEADNFLF